MKERIERIKDYFQGMEMKGNLYIVQVLYKDRWGAYPNEANTIKVAASENEPNSFFYYGDFNEVDLNDIFDLIESTIKNNMDAAKKLQLLNEKFNELKELFSNESLDNLAFLKFVIDKPRKKRKKKDINIETNTSLETTVTEEEHVQ